MTTQKTPLSYFSIMALISSEARVQRKLFWRVQSLYDNSENADEVALCGRALAGDKPAIIEVIQLLHQKDMLP